MTKYNFMTNTISIVLFIDDVPVGYNVTHENGRVQFTPTEFSNKACCPPHFLVKVEQGSYLFETALDEDVKAQVVAAMEQMQAGKLLTGE